MSPRRPHLRNRKKIKAPRRFDENNTINSSPRQESHEESEESSELEEEIYQSPKPKKPKSKPRVYHGKVTEFNPNLPPAAFPTLDHPDYVHNGGNIAIDLESHLSGLQNREPRLADSEATDPDLLGHGYHFEEIDPTMTSTTADFTRRGSQSVMQKTITVQKRPRASKPSSIYGESTEQGPIWANNMALMQEAGRMSDLDRNILEMESSDEEDAAARLAKLARTGSVPKFPAWDDLTVAHKLDLADSIAELYELHEDAAQVMHHLRLSLSQRNELVELLIQRQDRAAREEANQQKLLEQTKDILLQGRRLSQSTFHQMVEENLYETINENDPLQTNLMELKKARAYIRYCGFEPALADGSWDVPSSAAGGTKTRPAQSKPPASLSNTVAQSPPSPSNGPFSRRPAQFTPSQQASCPPDRRLELVQQKSQVALLQHRPIPSHTLIAQHSPAAPLSKVPVQSYRVAPSNPSGDLGVRDKGTTRIPQPNFPTPPVQPNASTGPDLVAINDALLKARGASSVLSTPQEQHSVPVDSHSLAHKGLPTGRENQSYRSSGNPNVRASAPQGTGGVVENGDSVNKKRRKKGVI